MISVLKNEIIDNNNNGKFVKINKYNYNYIYLFLRTFSKLIEKIKIINYVNNNFSDYTIFLKSNLNNKIFLNLITVLKYSLLFNFKYLNDITCADNINLYIKNNNRFSLFYVFQNILTTTKLIIVRDIKLNESIVSLDNLYKSSNWAEREIFDLFGIFFLNHPDLRKILTDYGFSGFPLRKDFPLTGYLELRYCEELKCVKYNKLKLMQEYRNFNFMSPWQQYLDFKTNEI